MTVSRETVRRRLLTIARARGCHKTFCPSEVARSLPVTDWRRLMPQVRDVALSLVADGQLVVTQQGQLVDPQQAQGPIRYRLNCHHRDAH